MEDKNNEGGYNIHRNIVHIGTVVITMLGLYFAKRKEERTKRIDQELQETYEECERVFNEIYPFTYHP